MNTPIALCAIVRGFHAALAMGGMLLSHGVQAQSSLVADWNESALVEVRAGKLPPPVVARALAIVHTCMYDAWTAYSPTAIGTALDPGVRQPASLHTLANKEVAVSYAAYQCLRNLFPAGESRLANAMLQRGYDPSYSTAEQYSAAGIGNMAAQAVIADRAQDGANQYGNLRPGAYSDYTWYSPRNPPLPYCFPGAASCAPLTIADRTLWQPLISDSGSIQSFLAPHWGRVRPFGFTSSAIFDGTVRASATSVQGMSRVSYSVYFSAPRPAIQSDPNAYTAQADEVLTYSSQLTPQRKLEVEYWADGPASELPPGHWGKYAQYVARRDAAGIDADVKMFFAMHNASMDAGIAAWYLKRKFDGVRPITMIRQLRQGQWVMAWGGPGRPVEPIRGERWIPYNPGSNLTPAFPGFVSGHTTFSWASAAVLSLYKVSDRFDYTTIIPPNFGRVEPGVPAVPTVLGYATFSAAATAAGMSRLYGGIHVSEDNEVGRNIGLAVGVMAWNRAQRLFAGYR